MDKFKEFADAVNRLHKSCKRVKKTLIKLDNSVPKVWLTVEEARICVNMARLIKKFAKEPNHTGVKKLIEFENLLLSRIEQVESK